MNDLKISKYISYILRHNPQDINVTLDKDGYCDTYKLIDGINKKYKCNFTLNDLIRIVDEDDKSRYSFSKSMTLIRANQGHSAINIEFEETMPPKTLYHGTAMRNLDSILEKGLLKGNRHHVHLTLDRETAYKVGKRYGEPVVLRIDTEKMCQDGINFYISDNNVYLCDYINPKYINVF